MTLVSPGVEVSIIDQSQYLPAPLGTIPFVLLATAANKADPTSTSVAAGTTSANANKLFQVTSQRDLVALYGNPFFYTTSNGTPIQGYELNEYGLLAAYSALGVSNRVYCLRADIDLASLVGQTGRPVGNPTDGTYWLDTTNTSWGIYVFNSVTGQFSLQTPIVISDSTLVSGGVPVSSLGTVGSYAVIAIPNYTYPSASTAGEFFYKTSANQWVVIGSTGWRSDVPTVQGSVSNPTLTAGDTLTIAMDGPANGSAGATYTVTVSSTPGQNTVAYLATAINNLAITYLSAAVVGGKLTLYSKQTGQTFGNQNPPFINLSGTGTILTALGITSGNYYQPGVSIGTSSQQPLWQVGQQYPRPTGSVWIKIGAAGTGFNPVISEWNSLTANWVSKTPTFATSDVAAIAAIDSTGGQNIPAGSIYAQYNYNVDLVNVYGGAYTKGPIYYWERVATGPTVVTGTNAAPTFANGPYHSHVFVSVPGSLTLSGPYALTVADNATATDFVTAWTTAGIPYTTASVLTSGEIQLTHTLGGVIIVNDYDFTTNQPNFLMSDAGFVAGTTDYVKVGPFATINATPTQSYTTGVGHGLQINVVNYFQQYNVDPINYVVAGSGYTVGDLVTFPGSSLGGTGSGGSVPSGNDLRVRIERVSGGGIPTAISFYSGTGAASYMTELSNWVQFDMISNEGAPTAAPADLTNWYYSVVDQVDIMVNTSTGWKGYGNVAYSNTGFPLPSGVNATDPNGPLVSATAPTLQSDGTALVYGDLWIDTSDLENYPLINRWELVGTSGAWVRLDNTDQTGPTGVLFADARWANTQYISPVNDPIPTIKTLLTSNYLDLDAPSSSLYPVGMLLFNTRRSGYNVKQFRSNYFNVTRFPGATIPNQTDAWVTISGLQSNGSPYMGRKAQRAVVVKAMREAIDTNTAIRDEDNAFNLIAAPNYPELQPNMVVLNNDIGDTAFIIGDTPLRLADNATDIQAWATNAAGATSTGEDGLVTRDTYLGLFYPSGITSDLSGNLVAVPASHMMIRTILRSDSVSYPWFAPAGTRRGIIDNATNIGYVDAQTGEFQVIKTRLGIRDVLYTNQINPMVFFTGNGLLNYGNKTSFASNSALDRINVARLTAYLRRQLTIAARPFVFEPNDGLTRQQIAGVIQTLFVDLVAKRGVYDYLVVCDLSNNTPARIDRNELWVDCAFEPVKAAEFIYIPVRVLNTGELGNNNSSS